MNMLNFLIQADYAELKAKEQTARQKFFRKKELEKNPNSPKQAIDASIQKDTSTKLKTKVNLHYSNQIIF